MSTHPVRRRSVDYTPDEMMTIAAARLLWPGCVCFVGIGTPSAAANLARLTYAPDIVLIYESGTIGTKPSVLPLSIGDGELAETATAVVSLPEIFSYWLQAGRIDVGFLGAAQIRCPAGFLFQWRFPRRPWRARATRHAGRRSADRHHRFRRAQTGAGIAGVDPGGALRKRQCG